MSARTENFGWFELGSKAEEGLGYLWVGEAMEVSGCGVVMKNPLPRGDGRGTYIARGVKWRVGQKELLQYIRSTAGVERAGAGNW